MINFLWGIFEKSGDINAFLAYKEFKNTLNFKENSNTIYIEEKTKDIK